MLHELQIIHCMFPVISCLLLIIGLKKQSFQYISSSLWISLIAIALHIELSNGHILGGYFDFLNAASYSFSLLLLIINLLLIISHLNFGNYSAQYITSFSKAFFVCASLIVLANIWINAFFIESRIQGSPIMQVALPQKPSYCSYKYIFYKLSLDGTVHYLCPDHYGLLPATGKLPVNASLTLPKQLFGVNE